MRVMTVKNEKEVVWKKLVIKMQRKRKEMLTCVSSLRMLEIAHKFLKKKSQKAKYKK